MNGKRFDSGIIRELDRVTGGRWERVGFGSCEALECRAVVGGVVVSLALTDSDDGVDFWSSGYASLFFGAWPWSVDSESSDIDLGNVSDSAEFASAIASLMVRPDGSVIAQCFAGVI